MHPGHDPLRRGQHSLHGEGDLAGARRWFDQAYRDGERSGDAATMVQAAIGLGGLWVHEHRGIPQRTLLRRRLRRALQQVDPGTPLHLQLRLRLAAEDDYVASRHDRILELLPQARRAGDPSVLAMALSLAHHCVLAPEHAVLRAELVEEMVEAAALSDRPGDMAMALTWRTVDQFLVADRHAERALESLAGWLRHRPHAAAGFVVAAQRVMLAIRAGRLAEAEAMATQCAVTGREVGDVDYAGWLDGHLVAVRWFEGRLADLVPHLQARVHSPALTVIDYSSFGALAAAAAGAGDRVGAALALGRLGGEDLSAVPRSSTWAVSMFGAVLAARFLGDGAAARSAYDQLLPFAARPMMVSLAVACFGSTEQALGVAALAMDHQELAVRHLRAAVRANLALGHWPAALHSKYWLGQALASSDDSQDRHEGACEQAEAAAEAGDRGWELPVAVPAQPFRTVVTVGAHDVAEQEPATSLHRHGGRWTLRWRERTVEVKHSIGMLYLALLLANPGQEIAASDLAAGLSGDPEVRADAVVTGRQDVFDDDARRSYSQRLRQLKADIEWAQHDGDEGRLADLQREHQWISDELGAATGAAGRPRTFTGNAERARISVGKALRRVVDRISEADAVVGDELRSCLKTGTLCCYRPRTIASLSPARARAVVPP